MRVIGGYLKGKKILLPIDKTTRPLKDMVRQSIFNILEHSKNEYINIKNSNILDLFSGTGSFGIECISRGAKKVIFFENNQNSIKILNKNLSLLNLNDFSEVINQNAYELNNKIVEKQKLDLIFLDPPFKDLNINVILNKITELKIISKKTLIIIHRNKKTKENFPENLNIIRENIYGLSKIIFAKII